MAATPRRQPRPPPRIPRIPVSNNYNSSNNIEAQLQVILKTQMPIVRGAFKAVDSGREGRAEKEELRRALLGKLFIAPLAKDPSETAKEQWSRALDIILSSADPAGVGVVEFGRLTRLIRSMRSTEDGSDGSSKTTDAELRERFGGVNVGNKQLTRRLKEGRLLANMPTATRTSSFLGDTNIHTPWAQMGDDSRMDHILGNVRKEKTNSLKDALSKAQREYAQESAQEPSGRASLVKRNRATKIERKEKTGLSLPHFKRALKEFDPHMHDAEMEQYFTTLTKDVSDRALPLRAAPQSSRASSARRAKRQQSVAVDQFIENYANSVVGNAALRNSAAFTLQWKNPRQR